MYNEDEQATRSTATSRTGSYNDGPLSRPNVRAYQSRSSIIEENGQENNEYEETPDDPDRSPDNTRPPQRSEDQYIAALRYRFPNRPKTDYAYSKPVGPAIPPPPPPPSAPSSARPTTTPSGATSTSRSGAYQSTIRPNTGGTNAPDTSDGRTFPRPALRRVNPDQQNIYASRITADATTATSPPAPPLPPATYPSKPPTSGPSVRINEPDIDRNRSIPSTFNRQSVEPPRSHESIFEKVPAHGGPVSYLGIGTFSQFEHCLHECLERERRQTGITSQITREDIPAPLSTLNYDYNSVSIPSHHGLDPIRVHQFIDYPSRPTATFILDDIRQINVALSRSGISLFPYSESYFSPISVPHIYPNERHLTGEVVSACRVVDEDPAVISSRNGSQAVQNVWNAIRNHRPFSYMSNVSSSRGPYDD